MDKVKEKLDKMRRETEAALERADEAERRLKESTELNNKLDGDVRNLQNKNAALERDLDTAEERLAEVEAKYKKAAARQDQLEAEVKSLNYKLTLAENDVDAITAERDKLRQELEHTLRQLDDM